MTWAEHRSRTARSKTRIEGKQTGLSLLVPISLRARRFGLA
jgi:hypothetical protein